MTHTIERAKHAELALAAYAFFPLIVQLQDPLEQAGMTELQARMFASQWRVVVQYNEQASGLSATVFENLVDGKRYLSVRGTEPTDLGDLGTDALVIFTGLEIHLSAQYRQLKSKVGEWLANGTLHAGFTVTGHSLGGFLATGIAADYAASVAHAYLYNTPGLNGILGSATATILNSFGITAPLDPLKVSNIKADAGLSPIAGLGAQVSPPIWVVIENQFLSDVSNPSPARNHSQEVLADALAVHAAYAALAPTLGIAEIGSILRASSARNKLTLEAALDALRTIVMGEVPPTREGERDDFYRNLYALRENAFYRQLSDDAASLRVLTGASADAIAADARQNFGAFLALHYLVPFGIDTATDVLSQVHADLHAVWLADRDKAAAGRNGLEYSDQWLADRAELLFLKTRHDVGDGDVVLRSERGETYAFENWDAGAPVLSLTVAGRQRSSVFTPAKVIFGSDASETISGSDVYAGDRIYGGGGDDTLIGGAGHDYLEGGRGLDTYVIESENGFVTIYDTDGMGRVVIDGSEMTGAYRLSDAFYLSGDGRFEYYLEKNEDGYGTLYVNGDVRIDGFRNGDLGIVLDDSAYHSPIQSSGNLILTDSMNERGTPFSDYYVWGISNSEWVYSMDGMFLGHDGDDFITTLDDIAEDYDGCPLLHGCGGNDTIIIRNRWSYSVGGAGRDTIIGGIGDDFLYGDSDYADFRFFIYLHGIEFSYSFGDGSHGFGTVFNYADNSGYHLDVQTGEVYEEIFLPEGLKDALIWFGMISPSGDPDAHNDYLYGGEGNDVMYGGAGQDTLFGGLGNDRLYGGIAGLGGISQFYNYSIIYLRQQDMRQPIMSLFYEAGDDFLDGGEGDDVLVDSDGGNDFLFGGDGNDYIVDESPDIVLAAAFNYLDGGDGDDVLIARNRSPEGFDVLVGGTGNDHLQLHGRGEMRGGEGDDQYVVRWELPLEVWIDNYDEGGFDTLSLLSVYWPPGGDSQYSLSRDASNLYFGSPGQLHSITILNWFVSDHYKIDRIYFYQGSLSADEIDALVGPLPAEAADPPGQPVGSMPDAMDEPDPAPAGDVVAHEAGVDDGITGSASTSHGSIVYGDTGTGVPGEKWSAAIDAASKFLDGLASISPQRAESSHAFASEVLSTDIWDHGGSSHGDHAPAGRDTTAAAFDSGNGRAGYSAMTDGGHAYGNAEDGDDFRQFTGIGQLSRSPHIDGWTLEDPEDAEYGSEAIARPGADYLRGEQMALNWQLTHMRLDMHLSRTDAENASADKLGFPADFMHGGFASDTAPGISVPGIHGHALPVFSNRFEGLREGLARIA